MPVRARVRDRLSLVGGAVPHAKAAFVGVHVDAPGQGAAITIGENTWSVRRERRRPPGLHPGLCRAGSGSEVEIRYLSQHHASLAAELQASARRAADSRPESGRAGESAVVGAEAVVGGQAVKGIIDRKSTR